MKFNFFSKKPSAPVLVAAEPTGAKPVTITAPKAPKSDVDKLIDEIHHSFYTEVDRLLEFAKVARPLDTDKQALINKAKRLEALGFVSATERVDGEREMIRLKVIEKENEERVLLVDAINYFTMHYPNYKFITAPSVDQLCRKYNLVYGPVNYYKGTVPDKNLAQIEAFSIKSPQDEWCWYKEYTSSEYNSSWNVGSRKQLEEGGCKKKIGGREAIEKCPLEIAAPMKDFDLSKLKVNGTRLEVNVPDPVVLQPVNFKDKKYYLILTAWGQEASDELVVNQRNN
jgi:hypothetical protein